MKSQRNKKCLYNHKFIKGIKINVHTVMELAHKVFRYCMHKVSHVLAERFSQDPLETYFWFCKQHPPGALKDNLPLYNFVCANTYRNQKVFKPIAAGNIIDEKNINFTS